MADVKWIKIVTDIFDDEKMLLIESLPSADSLIVIWFKLLCLAGKNNNDGVFLMNDRIAYTEEMLSTIFRRDINIVRLALDTFERFGMIEIINGVITIPNWGKHQTLDSYERKKERDRIYQAERRAKQKEIADKSSDKSFDVAISEEDIEEEREEDKDKEIYTSDSAQDILDLYRLHCPSLPDVRILNDKRRKHIKALLKAFTIEEITEGFKKAEASDFCKGKTGWKADFEFLINQNNMAKVLEGKYDNRDHKPESIADRWANI